MEEQKRPSANGVTIIDVLAVLLRHRRIIALTNAVSILCAAAVFFVPMLRTTAPRAIYTTELSVPVSQMPASMRGLVELNVPIVVEQHARSVTENLSAFDRAYPELAATMTVAEKIARTSGGRPVVVKYDEGARRLTLVQEADDPEAGARFMTALWEATAAGVRQKTRDALADAERRLGSTLERMASRNPTRGISLGEFELEYVLTSLRELRQDPLLPFPVEPRIVTTQIPGASPSRLPLVIALGGLLLSIVLAFAANWVRLVASDPLEMAKLKNALR